MNTSMDAAPFTRSPHTLPTGSTGSGHSHSPFGRRHFLKGMGALGLVTLGVSGLAGCAQKTPQRNPNDALDSIADQLASAAISYHNRNQEDLVVFLCTQHAYIHAEIDRQCGVVENNALPEGCHPHSIRQNSEARNAESVDSNDSNGIPLHSVPEVTPLDSLTAIPTDDPDASLIQIQQNMLDVISSEPDNDTTSPAHLLHQSALLAGLAAALAPINNRPDLSSIRRKPLSFPDQELPPSVQTNTDHSQEEVIHSLLDRLHGLIYATGLALPHTSGQARTAVEQSARIARVYRDSFPHNIGSAPGYTVDSSISEPVDIPTATSLISSSLQSVLVETRKLISLTMSADTRHALAQWMETLALAQAGCDIHNGILATTIPLRG